MTIYHSSGKALIYAILATICWSTVATAFKKTLFYFDNNVIGVLFFSNLFAVIALFLILWREKSVSLLLSPKKKILRLSLLRGLINPFIYYLILFKSYSLLPGSVAQPLNYTWPIVLTVLTSILFHQKLKPIYLFALCISFLGVAVIATQGRPFSFSVVNPMGVLLAISSSIVWSIYWILNMRDPSDLRIKLFLNFSIGFILITLITISSQPLGWPSWKGLLGTIWIGFFEMGITFYFWLKALETAKNIYIVNNIVYLSPFLSLIFLHFIANEIITFSSFIGLFIIISGILIQSL